MDTEWSTIFMVFILVYVVLTVLVFLGLPASKNALRLPWSKYDQHPDSRKENRKLGKWLTGQHQKWDWIDLLGSSLIVPLVLMFWISVLGYAGYLLYQLVTR